MILLGPIAGFVLGLTHIARARALSATGVAAAGGAALLGVASWHDSRSLPIGYWITVIVFTLASGGIFLAARTARERVR